MGAGPSGLEYLFKTYTLVHSPHPKKLVVDTTNVFSHVDDGATKCNLNIDDEVI
jgi:hypothetical protein